MAAEYQPLLPASDLLRDVCRDARKDDRVYRNLQDMASAMIPGLVSFECTTTSNFSFHIELGSYKFWVMRMTTFGDRSIKYVQIRYQCKPSRSTHPCAVAEHYINTLVMLQDVFTRIRELVAGDGR